MTAVDQEPGPDLGADQWGRVEYSSYFRPPGLPGQVTPTPPGEQWPIHYPGHLPLDERGDLSDHARLELHAAPAVAPPPNTLLNNSNPLHGFEAQRFPNLNYPTTAPYNFTPNAPAACRSTSTS